MVRGNVKQAGNPHQPWVYWWHSGSCAAMAQSRLTELPEITCLDSCCCSCWGWLLVWFSLFAGLRTTVDRTGVLCLADCAELTVAILMPFWAGCSKAFSPFGAWLIWALFNVGVRMGIWFGGEFDLVLSLLEYDTHN